MNKEGKKFEILKELTFLQWVSIVLTSISIVYGLYVISIGGSQPSVSSVVGFMISTSLAVITDRINRHIFENKTTLLLERDMNPSDLKFVGSSAEGVAWFRRNSHGSRLVYNTIFNRRNDSQMLPDELREAYGVMQRLIISGCSWNDFFIAGDEEKVDHFFSGIPEREKTKYSAIRIQCNVPLLQFLIMKFNEDKASVMFGWGFKGVEHSTVFQSSDPKTTDYFVSYAKQLLSHGEKYIENGHHLKVNRPGVARPIP